MTPSLESCLKTINQLEYQIALKDQALTIANTLISHLREENTQLKSHLANRSIYVQTQSLISSVVSNKQNEQATVHNRVNYVKPFVKQVQSERDKMRSRFKKLLNNNSSCISTYQSNRLSFNSSKVYESKNRAKSICSQKQKDLKLKTIEDDLKELKDKLEKKDVEITQIGKRNQLMENKYSKLLETLKSKNGIRFN